MKLLNKLTDEYLEDMLARLSHNSSAIEGNTLSYNETVSIVLNRTIPSSNKNINIREFYEVENHKYALEYILEELRKNKPLDIYILKEINNKLMEHLNYNKGTFKTESNAIKGADFETSSPEKTPFLMYQWVNNLNYRLENSFDEEEKTKIILEEHIKFERVHPFSDGNGRTGRMLMIYSSLQAEITPFIIPVDKKNDYYNVLREQNVEKFYELIKPLKEFELNRINKFFNKEKSSWKERIKTDKEKGLGG